MKPSCLELESELRRAQQEIERLGKLRVSLENQLRQAQQEIERLNKAIAADRLTDQNIRRFGTKIRRASSMPLRDLAVEQLGQYVARLR